MKKVFCIFATEKKVQLSACSSILQIFRWYCAEIKKLLASPKRDRHPVERYRGVPGRDLNRVCTVYTQIKNPSHRSVAMKDGYKSSFLASYRQPYGHQVCVGVCVCVCVCVFLCACLCVQATLLMLSNKYNLQT